MRGRLRQIGAVLPGWVRRWWWIAVLLGVALVAAYLARDIPNYPATRAAEYRNRPEIAAALATVEPKDRLTAEQALLQYQTDNEIKIWTTIVQAVGGALVLGGIWFTWRNLRVAQEGQITNRFTQAIEQLGAMKDKEPNLEVRLGGIYALERIARDSPQDHGTIMEILTAYVRQNARWTPPVHSEGAESSPEEPMAVEELPQLRTDIRAILTVLGRRLRSEDRVEPGRLNLSGTDLRRADLRGAHLRLANLRGAHLDLASLSNAHLERATLVGVHLEGAYLRDAHLNMTDLSRAENLIEDQLKRAASWQRARLPPDLAHLEYETDEKPTDFPSAAPSAPPPPATS